MTKAKKSPAKIPDTLAALAVPVDSLKPYPDNPRQGDIGAVVTSLEHNGQYRPIVVNARKGTRLGDGTILAGNHTWQAAQSLGWTEIAVAFVDVDDETATRIVLVDNRANDLATYDDGLLLEMVEAIAQDGGPNALLGTGFDGDDVDALIQAMRPLDLDTLAAKHGGPKTDDTWPVIRLVVPPAVHKLWAARVEEADGDELQVLRELLGA